MTDAVREAFERIALPNFGAVPTNELIDDHWQTWQEAWEEATRAALQYARDGLIRGRTRMREDNERLRAALAELLSCHTESAGWSMSMLTDRAEFDAMLARSQERLHTAIGAAREALGPNVGGEARLAAHRPPHTTTATPQGVASTDQLGGRVRSEKD